MIFIEWSAVQAVLFVPSSLMQCTFMQVNSQATTIVWVYECVTSGIEFLLYPGVLSHGFSLQSVWVWNTKCFHWRAHSPLMQGIHVQVVSHATTCIYERTSVWRQAFLLCPGVLSRSASSSLQTCVCVLLQSQFSCILLPAAAVVIFSCLLLNFGLELLSSVL